MSYNSRRNSSDANMDGILRIGPLSHSRDIVVVDL